MPRHSVSQKSHLLVARKQGRTYDTKVHTICMTERVLSHDPESGPLDSDPDGPGLKLIVDLGKFLRHATSNCVANKTG
jgi:hypothetical protein